MPVMLLRNSLAAAVVVKLVSVSETVRVPPDVSVVRSSDVRSRIGSDAAPTAGNPAPMSILAVKLPMVPE